MHKNSRIWIIVLLLLSSGVASASDGDYGLTFLKIDVDARAAAMAGAYTAVASDASAAFWNPAGLTGSEQKNLQLMHNVWLADIRQEFAAVQFMTGSHNLALSVNAFTIPGIEIRGERPTTEPLGEEDAINFSAGLSYATTIFEEWQAGLTVKYLYEKYYLDVAPGWALDIGLQKRNLLPRLHWGVAARNLGRMAPLKNTRSKLPVIVQTGLAWALPWSPDKSRPLITADVQQIGSEATALKMGAAAGVFDYITLRTGIIGKQDNTRWTGGLTIRYKGYHIDYAYSPFQYDLGASHGISLGFAF